MRIKKIKSEGGTFYPATITDAIKDILFKKVDNSYMTLSEINVCSTYISKYKDIEYNDEDIEEIIESNLI